ncbi:MAG: hypothetical protein RLZZ245_3522 [Verrucomicrobiota bacterium]
MKDAKHLTIVLLAAVLLPACSKKPVVESEQAGEERVIKAGEERVIKAGEERVIKAGEEKVIKAGEEKVIEIAPGVTMIFCWCPAGEFTMGSPKSEAYRHADEDQVEVTLSQGFWMAKTEVTQAQWLTVMGENPSKFEGANRPVENVSWHDAQDFLIKINASVVNADGSKMLLPTEAQWEYACRAGEAGWRYSGGTVDDVAWYNKNSSEQTHSVGTKKPNAWGLQDMHGNVWEWCADLHTSELKGGVDPRGAASGSYRMGRGGSWDGHEAYCRVAHRGNFDPSNRYSYMGFRVALVPSK